MRDAYDQNVLYTCMKLSKNKLEIIFQKSSMSLFSVLLAQLLNKTFKMQARLFTVLREGKCAQDRGHIIIKVCFLKNANKNKKEMSQLGRQGSEWSIILVHTGTIQEKTRKVNKILIVSWTKLKSEQIIFPLALTAGYEDKSPRPLCGDRRHPKIRAVGISRGQYLSVYWLLKSTESLSE